MSFIDGFLSFTINLTVPERGVYSRIRLRTPKHPDESLPELGARLLAFLHCYREGAELSSSRFDGENPHVSASEITGELTVWAIAGMPDVRALKRELKHHPRAEFFIYFRSAEEIDQFSHHLRGSRENWIAPIRFFLLDPEQLTALSTALGTSNSADATISDERLFLDLNGSSFDIAFQPVDVWDAFQRLIQNRAPPS